MSATPTEEQVLDATTAADGDTSVEAAADAGFGDEDLSILRTFQLLTTPPAVLT